MKSVPRGGRKRKSVGTLFGVVTLMVLVFLWHAVVLNSYLIRQSKLRAEEIRSALETLPWAKDIPASQNVTTDVIFSSETPYLSLSPSTEERILMSARQSRTLKEEVLNFAIDHPNCVGKEWPLQVVWAASSGPSSSNVMSTDICDDLPVWQNLTQIYGDGPVVIGLDTCQAYRDLLSSEANNGSVVMPMPRIAGLYHTGTNAAATSLERNFGSLGNSSDTCEGCRYRVMWGKHVPAKYRLLNTQPLNSGDSARHTLPIVLVRDPFRWMRSMCREPYDAEFHIDEEDSLSSCPELVLQDHDGEPPTNVVTVAAMQTGFRYIDRYDTLVDMWTEYYRQYLEADYPRLLIRYEDWLFYSDELLRIISACSGAPLVNFDSLQYVTEEARQWGARTNKLLESMRKLDQQDDLYVTRKPVDKAYINEHLDPLLLKTFQYEHTFNAESVLNLQT